MPRTWSWHFIKLCLTRFSGHEHARPAEPRNKFQFLWIPLSSWISVPFWWLICVSSETSLAVNTPVLCVMHLLSGKVRSDQNISVLNKIFPCWRAYVHWHSFFFKFCHKGIGLALLRGLFLFFALSGTVSDKEDQKKKKRYKIKTLVKSMEECFAEKRHREANTDKQQMRQK